MTLNPYEELNLPKTATTAEVKAAPMAGLGSFFRTSGF